MVKRGRKQPKQRGTNSLAELRKEAKAVTRPMSHAETLSHSQLVDYLDSRLGHEHDDLWNTTLLSHSMVLRTQNALSDLRGRWHEETLKRRLSATRAQTERNNGTLTEEEYVQISKEYNKFAPTVRPRFQLLTKRWHQAEEAARMSELPSAPRPQAPAPDLSTAVSDREVALERIVIKLTWAVMEHQKNNVVAGLNPEPHDKELWRVLNETTVIRQGRPQSLADLVFSGAWPRPEER